MRVTSFRIKSLGYGIGVNRGNNKFWRSTSARRFFSLFITVIWLSALLQPCVMASVADFGSSESHQSSSQGDHHPHSDSHGDDEPVCPHCKAGAGGADHCSPENDVVCDGDESYVYFSRIKPLDDDQFFKQSQLFVPGQADTGETDSVSKTVFFLGASLHLPAGPSLRDLYRVYLK